MGALLGAVTALGVPTDPAFLLNGWAVVVFLVLLATIGVPLVFIKELVHPKSTVEAMRSELTVLRQTAANDRQADREKNAAILEMLEIVRGTAGLVEKMQDDRDAAHDQDRERVDNDRGGTTTSRRARA